jgi:5-methylcytosine-specific restriction endonuclease McrA
MASLSAISDSELLDRIPVLLMRERVATADVIAYLAEIDRRRLYLEQACSSLRSFCVERLGYSEDEASKRVRVAHLARQVPSVLNELRTGAIHLTGLFLLAPYLTNENADALLGEARGSSRQGIEQLIARWYPKPNIESRIDPVASQPALPLQERGDARSGRSPASTCPETDPWVSRTRLEPLSASTYRVQFTAGEELFAKIKRAKELLSHVVSSGDLPALIERAIDALIEQEVRRRRGAGGPRKRRLQKPGSRHVAVEVVAEVWRRDAGQCSYVDAEGRRCSERRFLTIEHVQPHARGGPSTVENLSILCSNHNAHSARRVFGEAHIEKRRGERAQRARTACGADPQPNQDVQPSSRQRTETVVCSALCKIGFRKHDVERALGKLRASAIEPRLEPLLRAALAVLVS